MSVYLEVPDDAASLPSGWSQEADFSLTVVCQTDEKRNVKKESVSRSFDEDAESWGYTHFLELAALKRKSKGYIVNNTVIIKCDMTNICSSAITAGMYPAGNGGLLYIPAGTLANYTTRSLSTPHSGQWGCDMWRGGQWGR
jgi:hypothetical protein